MEIPVAKGDMDRVVPLILTCDRDALREFVASFHRVRTAMEEPIVVIDMSTVERLSAEYLTLIASMEPRAVFVHGRESGMKSYDSVQFGIGFVLAKAVAETAESESILFLEDDVVFSSCFVEALQALELPADAGFVSMYLPGDGFGSRIINPEEFWGTQCILFPRWAVQEMAENWDHLMANFQPGYDIRWSRYLAARGYKLYCTDRSYVQHVGKYSTLHGPRPDNLAEFMTSRRFVP
jgi:hypothetical protein